MGDFFAIGHFEAMLVSRSCYPSYIISHLDLLAVRSLSEASRRVSTLVDPVKCHDSLQWTKHHCRVYRHYMPGVAELCRQCVVDMLDRIGYVH